MDITTRTKQPYNYAVLDNIFPLERLSELRSFLTGFSGWFFHKQSFFEVYELNLDEYEKSDGVLLKRTVPEEENISFSIPSDCSWVKDDSVINELRSFLEQEFLVPLDSTCSICINCLVEGQSIGMHNDAPRIGFATHRFVVNLNPDYVDSDGGHFYVLKKDGEKPEIEKMIRPIINTGFAFESSPASFHAVGKVKEGSRFSLIFTYWHVGNKVILKQELAEKITVLKEEVLRNPTGLLPLILEESKKLQLKEALYENGNLFDYALELYALLKSWGCKENLCFAGFAFACWNKINAEKISDIKIGLGSDTLFIAEYFYGLAGNNSPDLSDQPSSIQILYFAHILVRKRITFFSHENWLTEKEQLRGIEGNLPDEAGYLYNLIYK
ncbi:2OG-Fe(II) oxygenase superfamily protein [Pseudarcicella hirudinis]|uniref:2OG-Fe(II) oxygenase superfamily protein n=1 Tax=Pseudarcicella hirudinis TaxID=1079859 RepID=A0A1I5TKB0_9BACT|nr:2OG-Fe(II) oxygenase [Pseudarcicella hirudinis]SFP83502.1 2OG-Fe(II) oxygenase superfamily protein [Pseudarcicella hirudinis]